MLVSVKFHVAKCDACYVVGIAALRENEFQEKKTTDLLHLLLPCWGGVFWLKLYGCRHQTVSGDIIKFERCFWGLFGFSYSVLGSICGLSSSLFMCSFVNIGVRAGFCFRSSSPSRVFVDYYFLVEQGWCCVLLQRKRTFSGFSWLQASGMAGSGPADESSNLSRATIP